MSLFGGIYNVNETDPAYDTIAQMSGNGHLRIAVGSDHATVDYISSSSASGTVNHSYDIEPSVPSTPPSSINVTAPSTPTGVARGANLSVTWAPNVAVAAPAQFSVWLVSGGGTWTQVGLFDADNSASYTRNVAADVPVDNGYSLYVYYRASSGAAWSVYGLAAGAVNVTAPTTFTSINVTAPSSTTPRRQGRRPLGQLGAQRRRAPHRPSSASGWSAAAAPGPRSGCSTPTTAPRTRATSPPTCPSPTATSLYVYYRASSGAAWSVYGLAAGTVNVTAPTTFTSINVTAPSTPTGVARGANLSVSWAPNVAVPAPAQFSVWLVSGGGTWTQVGLFDADDSATYTRNVAADVPVANGYSLYVYYRASSGAAWSVYGLAAGTVNLTERLQVRST